MRSSVSRPTPRIRSLLPPSWAIDYISVGPVWETPTKPGRAAVGLELVTAAAREVRIPFFAIGGIDPANSTRVVKAGARRLGVVRAIRDAENPTAVAESIRQAFVAVGDAAPGG